MSALWVSALPACTRGSSWTRAVQYWEGPHPAQRGCRRGHGDTCPVYSYCPLGLSTAASSSAVFNERHTVP